MRPLLWIAFGLVVAGVVARVGDLDLLADPVGWVLVLIGVRRLARAVELPLRSWLLGVGVVALLCSGPLWWPATARDLQHADPAVLWAVGLAEIAFQILLSAALARLAKDAGDEGARLGWRICEVGLAIGAIAPVLYFGAGAGWLAGLATLGQILQLAVLVLCFCYSGRAWAGAGPRPARPEPAPAKRQ